MRSYTATGDFAEVKNLRCNSTRFVLDGTDGPLALPSPEVSLASVLNDEPLPSICRTG